MSHSKIQHKHARQFEYKSRKRHPTCICKIIVPQDRNVFRDVWQMYMYTTIKYIVNYMYMYISIVRF